MFLQLLATFSLAALAIYVLYTRVIKLYMRYWFYRRQGIKFPALPIPIVGDFFEVIKRTIREPLRFHICDIIREGVKEECPEINGMIYPGRVAIFINGPELVQECYV